MRTAAFNREKLQQATHAELVLCITNSKIRQPPQGRVCQTLVQWEELPPLRSRVIKPGSSVMMWLRPSPRPYHDRHTGDLLPYREERSRRSGLLLLRQHKATRPHLNSAGPPARIARRNGDLYQHTREHSRGAARAFRSISVSISLEVKVEVSEQNFIKVTENSANTTSSEARAADSHTGAVRDRVVTLGFRGEIAEAEGNNEKALEAYQEAIKFTIRCARRLRRRSVCGGQGQLQAV